MVNATARKIEQWPLTRVRPFEANPKKHSTAQIEQIAASIREWGFTIPILVDEDGVVIAGHGRLLAAALLKLKTVPVIVARGWTDAQKRAYRIADNKLTENGEWDDALLRLELGELKGLGFSLALTGFDDIELDALFAKQTPPEEFMELNENLETEHSCPRCGYRWSGKVDAAPTDKADAA